MDREIQTLVLGKEVNDCDNSGVGGQSQGSMQKTKGGESWPRSEHMMFDQG